MKNPEIVVRRYIVPPASVPPIYLVTTYRRVADLKIGQRKFHNKRTVGWFPTLEEAIDIVEHNRGDLEEAGHYRWAVVEEMPAGLYGLGGSRMEPIWFEYRGDDRWERINTAPYRCPLEIKQALGFDRMLGWHSLG